MSARAYIFVPNDGGFTKPLAPAEVKSIKHIDDPANAELNRFSELFHHNNINMPFWLVDKGVMILGSQDQARVVSNIMGRSTEPTAANRNDIVADNDNKVHIAPVFSKATGADLSRPTADFNMVARDIQKIMSMASRPSIRGNHVTTQTLDAA